MADYQGIVWVKADSGTPGLGFLNRRAMPRPHALTSRPCIRMYAVEVRHKARAWMLAVSRISDNLGKLVEVLSTCCLAPTSEDNCFQDA